MAVTRKASSVRHCRALQRAEGPIVERPGQQDRHGGNRQHRGDAVTLGEGELHGGGDRGRG